MPFEVTGRTLPEKIMLDSAGYEAAQEALMLWRSVVANWSHDHGGEEEVPAYGRVLAVLVSRADGISADLEDALRWRLNSNEPAARRAGLTDEERDLLTAPDAVADERKVLSLLEEARDSSEMAACAETVIPVVRKHHKVVIFCGSGKCAGNLHDYLRDAAGDLAVAEHTRRRDPESCEAAVRRWRDHGGVLICDDSAEDGLNLQAADAIVHLRLPWSPNRLEQRLGRVDRYDGTSGGHPPPGSTSSRARRVSILSRAHGFRC